MAALPRYQPAAAGANPDGGPETPASSAGASALDTTFDLLVRAKAGEPGALDRLFARLLPPLRRWAKGRLPRSRRDLMDTDDLVQEAAVRVVNHVEDFDARHDHALHAYMRQAVMNRVRDEIRRGRRIPPRASLQDHDANSTVSPLDEVIGRQAADRYEASLGRLRAEDRLAIIARVELDQGYQEIADALGKPSAEAARVAVSRALVRLAREMTRDS